MTDTPGGGMSDQDILERLWGLGLRPHVNRLRGAVVVKRASDRRPVTSEQWWRGGLDRAQLERLVSDVDFRQDYLSREWGRGQDSASLRDPPTTPEPPGDLKDPWSDDEDRWDAPRDG